MHISELYKGTSSLVSIITATLNRPSLREACESVNLQTLDTWHHYVIGDGVLPEDLADQRRTTIGFSRAVGAFEPSADMPYGTPNPIYRWALQHLTLGEYVCFLDDDNAYKPEFLSTMIRALIQNPDAGIAICSIEDLRFGKANRLRNQGHGNPSLYRVDNDPNSPPWDAYPECGRCDNSGFLTYSYMAKYIGFPMATLEIDAIQDFQFISTLARNYGWVRVPQKLVSYGVGRNFPPPKYRTKVV